MRRWCGDACVSGMLNDRHNAGRYGVVAMQKNHFVVERSEQAGVPLPHVEVALREQYGDAAVDVIVDSLLTAWARRTGTDLSECRYVEIGVTHPIANSLTYLLHRGHRMTGALVTANTDMRDALKSARPADEVAFCAIAADGEGEADCFVSSVSELRSANRDLSQDAQDSATGEDDVRKVPVARVNTLLEAYFSEDSPLFLAVAADGRDADILQDVDWARWRPAIVKAEQSDQAETGQGREITRLMQENDYLLIAKTSHDLLFVAREALSGGLVSAQIDQSTPVPTAPFLVPNPSFSKTSSVGIVMRTKNREVLLRRALESVKSQTYPHWQLVVVNDGGETASVNDLVDTIFDGDERVTVVHHPQSVGMEAASNAGLSRLNTELGIIHDDDDTWAPNMLAVTTAALRQQNAVMPSVRGVVTRVNRVLETVVDVDVTIDKIEPWNENSPDRLSEGLIDLPRLARVNLFPPIAFLFDLSLCRKIGGFDQNLPVLGDWDFHLRFCMQADIWVHPEPLAFYHHRKSATGDLGNTVFAEKAKHELYNTYLRNKLLREIDDPKSAVMVMLREVAYSAEKQRGTLDRAKQDVRNNGDGSWPVKNRTKLGTFLSELNRKRKVLRDK